MFTSLLPFALGAFLTTATAVPLDARSASSTSTSPYPTFPPFTASDAEIKAIQQALILAPSEVDRQQVLIPNPPDSTNITFQFVNVTHSAPTGGEIILNTVDNFPALIGTKGNLPIYLFLLPDPQSVSSAVRVFEEDFLLLIRRTNNIMLQSVLPSASWTPVVSMSHTLILAPMNS